MAVCWAENPADRPKFGQTAYLLNSINPYKGELMDNLILLVSIGRREYSNDNKQDDIMSYHSFKLVR